MSWNVIARVGPSDDFDAGLGQHEPRIIASVGRPGDRWAIGTDVLQIIFARTGRFPSPLVSDLIYLAFAVYTADLRIPRDLFEDRWTRDLVVHLPVSDPDRWNEHVPLLRRMLRFLTGDHWEIRARPMVP